METIFKNDSSFFYIESEDIQGAIANAELPFKKNQNISDLALGKSAQSVTALISNDTQSLTITEELGKITTGTLALKDESHIYSKIFRTGMKFNLTWGYKSWDVQASTRAKLDNPNELLGNGVRKGLRCIIQQPGGGGDNSGTVTYNVTFFANEILNGKEYRRFDFGTYRSVVIQLFSDLDVNDFVIDFRDQNQALSTSRTLRQREGSFKLLLRLATQFKAFMHIGYKQNGEKIGIFIDGYKLDSIAMQRYMNSITGGIGSEKTLFYNDGEKGNVKNYTWQHHIGESGQGSGVNVVIINGQPVFQRFIAEEQKVITYKLNNKKISAKLKNSDSFKKTLFSKNMLNATEFKQVEWAFDEVETVTAPEGIGFSVNCNMMGDPLLMIPLRVIFKGNWPSPLRQDQSAGSIIKFFLRKATHTFNKANGYSMTADIADTYTINGSFVEFAEQIS
jgi:hypothetical protein